METKIPTKHSRIGRLISKLIHNKVGAFLAYHAGLSGFNRIDAYIIRANGKRENLLPTYNSRTDKGAALLASLLSGSSLGSISSPLPAAYIALSTSSLTAAKTDTTLTGETVVSGLARAIGSAGTYTAPSVLDGACSYVLSKTFTAGAAGPTTIVSAAIFDAASTGNLFVEANLSSSAVLGLSDQLVLQWSINL